MMEHAVAAACKPKQDDFAPQMTAHIILFLPLRSEEANKCQSSDEYRKVEEHGSVNLTVGLCAAISGPDYESYF